MKGLPSNCMKLANQTQAITQAFGMSNDIAVNGTDGIDLHNLNSTLVHQIQGAIENKVAKKGSNKAKKVSTVAQ